MSFHRGPKIVTRALAMYFDANDTNCYVSGSTSLVNIANTSKYRGTLNGGATHLSGSFFWFDGSNDNIAVPMTNNTDVNLSGSTTIFVAELPVVSGGQRAILSYRSVGGGALYIGKNSGMIFSYYQSLNGPGLITGSISANTPFMCAVVCDAAIGEVRHYINGVHGGKNTGRTGFSAAYGAGNFYLGFDGGTNEYFLGNIYSFMHYSTVLTDVEIRQNFNVMRGRFGI